MQKFEINVKKTSKIRDFLLNYGFSNTQTNKILKNKDVKRDGKRLQEDEVLNAGETVVVFCEEPPKPKVKKLYEDDNVVVVSKGPEIEVQGDSGVEKLLPGSIAVHRLDRNTTGVLILAKNEQAEKALKDAFKNKTIEKLYVCEVVGKPNFKGELQEAYLVKNASRSEVKIYKTYVQKAVKISSRFKTVKQGEQTSLVVAQIFTGKTHQIRAQLAFMGFPIVGDGKYGNNKINKKFKQKYQKLHCFSLKIEKIDKNFEYLKNKAFIDKPQWAEKYI